MAVRSLAPLLRGEGWGERTLDILGLAESPPHPALRADLSPQAGRGKKQSRCILNIQGLVAAEDAVLVEGDAAVA
jgi:hypothetical protein